MAQIIYNSPIGALAIVSDGEFITELRFKNHLETQDKSDEIIKKCVAELELYFAGKLQAFTVPIKPSGTDFQKIVWEELEKIPYGEVISYKELAKRINNPKAIRAVGGANNRNPISIIIPCHRVIGMNGKLVGYGGGLENKEFLLNHESKIITV